MTINIVKDIQKDIFGFDYEKIEISIDETNIASLKLFEDAGFIRVSKEDELINFVYQRRNEFEFVIERGNLYEKNCSDKC